MATHYVGARPVLKGRSSANAVNPYKGSAGTYSNWAIWNTDQVLDGAPDNNVAPGTGNHPGNRFLSQLFNGTTLYVHPLSGTFQNGIGERFDPLTYKGLAGAVAFPTSFGHVPRETDYSYDTHTYRGVASSQVMTSVGHAIRAEGSAGTAASFGHFAPYENKGVTSTTVFDSGYGQTVPVGYDNEYGRNRVLEHRGVPSSKAL